MAPACTTSKRISTAIYSIPEHKPSQHSVSSKRATATLEKPSLRSCKQALQHASPGTRCTPTPAPVVAPAGTKTTKPRSAVDSTHETIVDGLRQSVNSIALGAAVATTSLTVALGLPEDVFAAGGTLTATSVELFKAFLEEVEVLGPWGPLLFVAVVMVVEMVPLLPTQPLLLASGLMFGTRKGAALLLAGLTLGALNAFFIARGFGQQLGAGGGGGVMGADGDVGASMLSSMSMSMSMDQGGEGEQGRGGADGASDGSLNGVLSGDEPPNGRGAAVARRVSELRGAIASGGFWRQYTTITLLRLTPVVPFSASNYLLGLTPVQPAAFLAGTATGMAVWSAAYASLGGASRRLLDRGADLGGLLADLADNATEYTSALAGASLAAGGVAAAYFAASRMMGAARKQERERERERRPGRGHLGRQEEAGQQHGEEQ